MTDTETKTCSKCKKIKPLEAFGRREAIRDGLSKRCKECVNVYYQTWLKKLHQQRSRYHA